MKKAPTDFAILDAIYERYYDAFVGFDENKPARSSKSYVPIDVDALARHLGIDGDILFGRLYYHLDQKYGYRQDDGSHVYFFAPRVGGDRQCVNFPYLASVLAQLRDEDRKYRVATVISVVSLVLSVVSLAVSLL